MADQAERSGFLENVNEVARQCAFAKIFPTLLNRIVQKIVDQMGKKEISKNTYNIQN